MASNTLTTKLRIDGAAFDRGLKRAENQAKNFGRRLISQVGGAVGLGGGLFGANSFFSTDIVESQRASEVLGGGASGASNLRALDESFTRLGLEGDGQAASIAGSFDAALRAAQTGDRGAAGALMRQGFIKNRKDLDRLAADPIQGLIDYTLNPPELSEAMQRRSRADMSSLGLERVWAAQRTDPNLRKILQEQLDAGATFSEEEARSLKNLSRGIKSVGVGTGRIAEDIGGAFTVEEHGFDNWLNWSKLGNAIKRVGGAFNLMDNTDDRFGANYKKDLRPNE